MTLIRTVTTSGLSGKGRKVKRWQTVQVCTRARTLIYVCYVPYIKCIPALHFLLSLRTIYVFCACSSSFGIALAPRL